jgi:hypothetical protein
VKTIIPAMAMTLLSGCAAMQPATQVITEPSRDWRAVATDDDRARLRDWRSDFVSAL